MDMLSKLSSPLRFAALALLGLLPIHNAAAETEITNDYIYIAVEAEDHIDKNERWVLTTPSTPSVEQDPDGNHSDLASGNSYLELLPDIRVTHDDPMLPPRAYWGMAGDGPHADYLVDFPEPGRYYVHVRAYSTGTEDNGIHFGLNGEWPESSERVQFCSASKRSWWWSSAQRDSGGNGSCGIEKSIWLDIPSAGTHTVSISAREDGFEIDRFVLLKDLSDNTRVCSPKQTAITGVNCVDGSIESADGFTDLRLRLQSIPVGADPEVDQPNPTEVEAGSNIELTALIENLDSFDTATDIVLTLSPVDGEWLMDSMDNRCTQEGSDFNCTLSQLHPTAPNENAPFKFIMTPNAGGDLRIDASVVGAQTDESPNNDVAATIIRVIGDVTPVTVDTETDVKLSLGTDKNAYETGERIQITAKLSNIGQINASDVSFSLYVPTGLEVVSANLPTACTDGSPLTCDFASIADGQDEVVSIELDTLGQGIFTLSATASAANDPDSGDNLGSDTVRVDNPEPEPQPEPLPEPQPDPETGDTGDSGVDEGTDGNDVVDGGDTDIPEPVIDETETDETLEAIAGDDDSGMGSMTYWLLFLLTLVLLTRLYWWHQRQLVSLRK